MLGAKQGLQHSDPTIAELLKPHGYATAQIVSTILALPTTPSCCSLRTMARKS
jgi:arylsulfatase A-like enzyme